MEVQRGKTKKVQKGIGTSANTREERQTVVNNAGNFQSRPQTIRPGLVDEGQQPSSFTVKTARTVVLVRPR
jgi:hypothetical protein